MTATAQIALLVAVPTALFVAFLRMPQWFSRSIHRHYLWRLRDDVADDVIDGRLPKDHPAVRDLLRRSELVIETSRAQTMLSFHVWSWVWKRQRDPALEATVHAELPALDGLSTWQAERTEALRQRLWLLCTSSVLLGTWIGIATIIGYVPSALAEARRRAHAAKPAGNLETEVRATIRVAADRAANETWLGRCSSDFVARAPDSPLSGMA